MAREDAHTIVSGWLRQLSTDEPPALEQGIAIVQIGEAPEIIMQLAEDGSALGLYTILVDIEPKPQVALFAYSLTLNVHQRFTRGGAIGLDVENEAIVLTTALPVTPDPAFDFAGRLADFDFTAATLREDFQKFLQGLPAALQSDQSETTDLNAMIRA
jgi:hypothetical protein